MKIAILETDILHEKLRSTYVGYGVMCQRLLRNSGVAGRLDIYAVIQGEYPASMHDYDAYLITGSKYDSFADDPWIVQLRDHVCQLFEAGKPLLGICFGHQLLAHALGGRAGRCQAGWGLGVMQYQVHNHAAFIDHAEPVQLIVSHQDQVLALPPGAQLLLGNDFCPNAAFHVPNRVLAFQGHPEFSAEYAKALLAIRAHQFPEEYLARVQQSYALGHHGERIGKWMQRFIEMAVAGRQGHN